jgi:hypothetical protein
MGLSVLEVGRMAGATPLEAEGGLPPLVSIGEGEEVHFVGRWDEHYTPGLFLRWLVWLVWRLSGGKVIPQPWEEIGVASTKERADAACLDGTYYTHAFALDRMLPREPVRVAGVSFPKRALHRLLRPAAKDPVDPYVLVRQSEWEEVKATKAILSGAVKSEPRV